MLESSGFGGQPYLDLSCSYRFDLFTLEHPTRRIGIVTSIVVLSAPDQSRARPARVTLSPPDGYLIMGLSTVVVLVAVASIGWALIALTEDLWARWWTLLTQRRARRR